MRVNVGTVRTFPGVQPDKAQAVKVVEEAAEVFGAWQYRELSAEHGMTTKWADADIVAELADCVTACANFAAALGAYDLARAVKEAEARNEERGRYTE